MLKSVEKEKEEGEENAEAIGNLLGVLEDNQEEAKTEEKQS